MKYAIYENGELRESREAGIRYYRLYEDRETANNICENLAKKFRRSKFTVESVNITVVK